MKLLHFIATLYRNNIWLNLFISLIIFLLLVNYELINNYLNERLGLDVSFAFILYVFIYTGLPNFSPSKLPMNNTYCFAPSKLHQFWFYYIEANKYLYLGLAVCIVAVFFSDKPIQWFLLELGLAYLFIINVSIGALIRHNLTNRPMAFRWDEVKYSKYIISSLAMAFGVIAFIFIALFLDLSKIILMSIIMLSLIGFTIFSHKELYRTYFNRRNV